ncbi:MAG TPA: glycosyltransferase family 2 protein [Cytophagaceae bacterium]|nr:glycosyltransferase family 2 protein [Cytophagaceae bacterium]
MEGNTTTEKIDLSVIIPVYNGAYTISRLVESVVDVLTDISYEIILVNDGSSDDSESVCEELAFYNFKIKFISLRKNFGEHNAVLCGLNATQGQYSVIIDDDFQNPPSEIRKLYTHIVSGGYDVVYSKYEVKKHGFFRNLGSKFHNWMATYILDKPSGLYLSSFKILKRELVDEVVRYTGPYPYVDGLILQSTNNIGVSIVQHQKRESGKSNYTLRKLISLYLNMFINHSLKPIRIFMLLGIIFFLLGVISTIVVFTDYVINHTVHSSWVYFSLLLETMSGLQLLFIGIVGEYMIKRITAVGGYPQFVIKSMVVAQKKRKVQAKEYSAHDQ